MDNSEPTGILPQKQKQTNCQISKKLKSIQCMDCNITFDSIVFYYYILLYFILCATHETYMFIVKGLIKFVNSQGRKKVIRIFSMKYIFHDRVCYNFKRTRRIKKRTRIIKKRTGIINK